MTKSELIAKIQKEIDATGDLHVLSYKIVDEIGGREFSLLSRTRKDSHGYSAKMNVKEFKTMLNEMRVPTVK